MSVDFDSKAKLPQGTELDVKEIGSKDKETYNAYRDMALDALSGDKKGKVSSLELARFYDISLLAGNGEVEPAKPVDVTIDYDEKLSVPPKGKAHVVHFTEDEKTGEMVADVLDQDSADFTISKNRLQKVTFEADSFSVYAVVYTVDFEYEAEGEKYSYSLL